MVKHTQKMYVVETELQRAMQSPFFIAEVQVDLKVCQKSEVMAITTFWSRATSTRATISFLRSEA